MFCKHIFLKIISISSVISYPKLDVYIWNILYHPLLNKVSGPSTIQNNLSHTKTLYPIHILVGSLNWLEETWYTGVVFHPHQKSPQKAFFFHCSLVNLHFFDTHVYLKARMICLPNCSTFSNLGLGCRTLKQHKKMDKSHMGHLEPIFSWSFFNYESSKRIVQSHEAYMEIL